MQSVKANEPAFIPQEATDNAISVRGVVLTVLAGAVAPALLAYLFATTHEVQVFAIVLGVIALVLTLRNPFFGLIVFVGLLYTRPEEVIEPLNGMHFSLIASVVTLAGTILKMRMNGEKAIRTPLNGMIVGFGLIVILSTLGQDNTNEAAQDIGKLVILVLLVLNLVRTPAKYKAFVSAILAFTCYLALYSIYQFFQGAGIQDHDVLRSQATGIFGDPNDLAATVLAGLALTLVRVKQSGNAARIGYAILAAVDIWGILLTNSRGGLLALMMVLGIALLLFTRVKAVALLIAAILGIGFMTFGPSRLSKLDSNEESANSRFWFWANGVDQLSEHPFIGVGYDQFPGVNGGMTAHNSFVLCFAELGFTGYFCWLGCLYYCFQRIRPKTEAETRAGPKLSPGVAQSLKRLTPGGDRIKTLRRESWQMVRVRPDDPEYADRMAARLALFGFLAACFWLSRTYVPVLYLLISLPIAQQISSRPDAFDFMPPKPVRYRDWTRIALIAVTTVIFIGIIANKYK